MVLFLKIKQKLQGVYNHVELALVKFHLPKSRKQAARSSQPLFKLLDLCANGLHANAKG